MIVSWSPAARAAQKRRREAKGTVNILGSGDEDADARRAKKVEEEAESDEGVGAKSAKLREEGNELAEAGELKGAVAKWEAALFFTPNNAILHEQRAQVLLDMGRVWESVQSAERAVELEPSWAEAWLTLARAQRNFGEPSMAKTSALKAVALEPTSREAQDEVNLATNLESKVRQLMREEAAAAERLAVGGVTYSRPAALAFKRISVRAPAGCNES